MKIVCKCVLYPIWLFLITGAAPECAGVVKEMPDLSSLQKVNRESDGDHILLEQKSHSV